MKCECDLCLAPWEYLIWKKDKFIFLTYKVSRKVVKFVGHAYYEKHELTQFSHTAFFKEVIMVVGVHKKQINRFWLPYDSPSCRMFEQKLRGTAHEQPYLRRVKENTQISFPYKSIAEMHNEANRYLPTPLERTLSILQVIIEHERS